MTHLLLCINKDIHKENKMYYMVSGILFFLALVVARFAELPANVTPLLAMAIFAPRIVSTSWLQPLIPLMVLVTTDYFLGWYSAAPVVYVCVIMASILGSNLKNLYVAGTFSVAIWHVLVNGAVWASGHVDASIWQVYAQAIVFDLRLLVSTLVTLMILDTSKKFFENTITNRILGSTTYEKNDK